MIGKNFKFVTIQPDFVQAYLSVGIFRAAENHGSLHCETINPRVFATDRHASIDGRPFGGGDSMIMSPEPLTRCLESMSPQPYVIYPSVRGKIFCQEDVERLLKIPCPLVFVCGRFGGVDERFIELMVDEELSLGNFVISGGELAALTIADALCRHLEGALGNARSAKHDSLQNNLEGYLEAPEYTRPENFRGMKVPAPLLSGNHKLIDQWRKEHSERVTRRFRPELLKKS